MNAIDGRQAAVTGPGGHAVHEEVELFGGPDLVFGCRHVPSDGALAGVVVCSPLPYGADAPQHLPDLRLGRLLARAGLVVQRFHYRGTGNSDGDPAALSLDTMAGDAREALEHLRHRCGVERVALVGSAAGAAVAAAVARDMPGAPVALWRPFEPASPGQRLPDLLGSRPRPVLLAAAGVHGSGPGLADDVAHWRSQAFDVETVPATDEPGAGMVEATAAWLVERLPGGRVA